MSKSIIKKGDKYGRLTAVKHSHKVKTHQHWFFKCSCGNEKVICVDSVKSGKTKSCGCLRKEQAKKQGKNNTTHGMKGTRAYKSWQAMKQRCLNKNCSAYKNYGGRGITICTEWLESFENFYEDIGERPEGKSLDRIKNNLGYYKSNCKWSTRKEQNNNTRQNRLLTYKGKTQTLAQWSEELGISYNIIWKRLRRDWSVEKVCHKF